jgi:RNA polymerase sigma-70 factor, ECF subfamily
MTDDSEQAALLRAVHDEHAHTLLRYVLRLTRGDMPFAEDVVQESLLRLWRKPEVLQQPTDNVRAWLFTVARNLVIDDRRSARYTRELQTEYLPERSSPDAIGPAFDKWILSDALLSLSVDHRTVIVRAYYLGQTVADIAQQEGIPEGTVKSRLHYALRALRISLQERGVVR